MQKNKPRVLVTHWVHSPVRDFLAERFEVIANPERETWSRGRVLSEARECDAIMAFMPDAVDDDFLGQCPRLKIVAAALKGPDNFDIGACTRRGVWFTLVPDLLTVPTAELAIALLLGITRRVLEGDDHVRGGKFSGWRPELYGRGLTGRTLGIIGMGAVGRAISARVAAFGIRVLYADPVEAILPDSLIAERTDLVSVITRSDFLMPLTHLNRDTYRMIGANALASMKPGAFLVNVGRGSLVDEAAVAASLASGHLAGYAADVFEMEDWAMMSRPREIHPALLADRARTLFTPHIGSAVDEVRQAIAMEAALNIAEALEGRRPRGAVNDIALARTAAA
jgi:phosphonate dehydrogenase